MKKTWKGGCHCGRVRFEAGVDLEQETCRCNCSFCGSTRFWFASVDEPDFRLVAGESDLADYLFGKRHIHHLFCRHCGVRPFGWAAKPDEGKTYAVAVTCLDDVTPEELAAAPVTCFDGINDNWSTPPAVTRHL